MEEEDCFTSLVEYIKYIYIYIVLHSFSSSLHLHEPSSTVSVLIGHSRAPTD